jgi:aerobic carbon-monoxide dehydrogenase medium subunit
MCLAVLGFEAGRVAHARVGIGGAEPRPRRIPEAEAVLLRQPLDKARCRAAAEAAAAAVDPMNDVQADAEYRRDLVLAMVRRALEKCLP